MKKNVIYLRDMNEDYVYLKRKINDYYFEKEDFELVIETNEIENYTMFMIYDFSVFLNNLKKENPQYLKHTTIYIDNKILNDLLYYLFHYLLNNLKQQIVVNQMYYN